MNFLQEMGVLKGIDTSLSSLREIITLPQIQKALSPTITIFWKRN